MTDISVVWVDVEILNPSTYNPRKLSQKAEDDLTKSIKRFGLVDPIIVNNNQIRKNIIIGGHQRYSIAKRLNLQKVPVVYLNLDIEKEKELNLRLNQNTGEWDYQLLKEFDVTLLLDIGFDDKQLHQIWDEALEVEEDNFDVNQSIATNCKTNIKEGDLFQLGDHFLMCGDATNLNHVNKLTQSNKIDMVYCDSPYNISLDYSKGISTNGKYKATKTNDSKTTQEYEKFLSDSMLNAIRVSKKDAHFFYYCDQNWIWLFQNLYQKLGINHKRVCIWIKNNANLTPQIAFNKVFEPCIYGTIGNPYINNKETKLNEMLNKEVSSGNRLHDDILDLFSIWLEKRKAGQDYLHPTEKPPTLHEKPLRRCTKPGDKVLDTFGGSGSTLIACDQLKRRSFTLEIDPVFVAVIIERFQRLTGKEVKHVN